MENPLDRIIASAKENPRHIVMAEGIDPRINAGSQQAVESGVAKVTLVGDPKVITKMPEYSEVMEIANPDDSELTAAFGKQFFELRKHKGITEDDAQKAVLNPLVFAAMMVREGDADGTVAGAINTTANTVRAALQVIGKAPDADMVSSFFLMVLDKPHHEKKGTFVFADAGLTIGPDAKQLASIAMASADSYTRLVGNEARVAMLSFSTAGSAKHERVTQVVEATDMVRNKRPELIISGEMQFDAAFVPSVAASKAPDAVIKGDANILVFPSLEAANIGYKIAQRIGGALAIGPILQGLSKPANDLSRGCNAEDVYNLIAVTSAQVSG
ncbi:MAG: phosphate acetyltransferase [Hyphomicrobiales bacterium]